MASVKSLNLLNDKALIAVGERRPEKGPGKMGIQALRAGPPYFGFVDGQPLDGINFVMFLNKNDDGVALRFLWNGGYEPLTLALWSVLAKEARVIVDIGAHTGSFTLAAMASNPKATVAAFEPHGLNYGRLVQNLRANGFEPSWAFQVAVSQTSGMVSFSSMPSNWYHSTGGRIGRAANQMVSQVPCTTLGEVRCKLMAKLNAKTDLVKIDTEGHELEVLRGGDLCLSEDKPDLFLESVWSDDTGPIEKILRDQGYSFYLIDDETFKVSPVEDLKPIRKDGEIDMERLNRLASCRTYKDVMEKAELAKNGLTFYPQLPS